MRILIVTHYFPLEIGAPQARLSELARFSVAEGEEVVVLTGMTNHPTGVVPPAYRRRARVHTVRNGVDPRRFSPDTAAPSGDAPAWGRGRVTPW